MLCTSALVCILYIWLDSRSVTLRGLFEPRVYRRMDIPSTVTHMYACICTVSASPLIAVLFELTRSFVGVGHAHIY